MDLDRGGAMGWRDLRAAAVAWSASMMLWLVFTATVSPSSVVMGAAVAAVAATGNAVVRRHLPVSMAFPAGTLRDGARAAARLPLAVVTDTARVFSVLALAERRRQWPPAGTVRVPVARRPEPEAAVVDLLATVTANCAPNTVVLGRSHDGAHLVVHQLVRQRVASAGELFRP
jgi:multisubunit Na+/H+ antiporter MnhE subunit